MTDIIGGARRRLNARALSWALRRKFGSAGVNTAAMRNISIFPKLNMAFNRVKKNGNSTTVAFLHAIENENVVSAWRAKRQASFVRQANLQLLMDAGNFFYFVIVRDPYSRTLSAFLNKFNKPSYVERFGAFDLSPDGFNRFTEWLARSGLEEDAHWDLQKKSICGALQDFDAVLRFEDFPRCLEDLVLRRGLKLPDEGENMMASVHPDTRTGAAKKLEQFYSPDSIATVRALYQDDFDFLGYPAEFMSTDDRGAVTPLQPPLPLQTQKAVS